MKLLLGLVVSFLPAILARRSATSNNSLLVTTKNGIVQGAIDTHASSVRAFKGIPFAATTAGANRWKAPQDPASWTGVRNATVFGDACIQSGMGPNAAAQGSEDCLTVNVWTPSSATTKTKLPVFVWIYGGRFTSGSTSDALYDGAGLAAKDVVVVSLNYRLGVFGFLALDELQKESTDGTTGNYGHLDQIKALKWVRDNIAAFGGDASKVTIGGQSAGCSSVYHLVNSPLAKNLFRGAICESGIRSVNDPQTAGLATSYRNLTGAKTNGAAYIASLNTSSLAELRAISAASLLYGNGNSDPDYAGSPPIFRTVLDGYFMTETYSESLASGAAKDVVIMTGNTKDESGASPTTNVTVAAYEAAAKATYGSMVDEYLTLYPATTTAEASNQTNDAARDVSRVGTWLFANALAKVSRKPFYSYFWTHAPPGQSRGAYHMSEINYVFNNLYGTNSPWTADDYTIADMMSSYWANFVKHLNPNGAGLVTWPATSATSLTTMQLDLTAAVIPIADAKKTDFITRWLATQKTW